MNVRPIILWKNHLSVGVSDVDDDHKKLIKMINRLFGATLSSEPDRVLQGVLDELTEYVVMHFNREEEYMRRLTFPHYQEHKQDHQKLLIAAGEFRRKLTAGNAPSLKNEIEQTLRDWLIAHIQGQDKKMGEFLNAHGVR